MSIGARKNVLSKQSIRFYEIIEQFEQKAQKDFQLTPIGSGGRVHDKIEKFDLFLSTFNDFTLQEARELEVNLCELLLDIVNNDLETKLLMDHYPFTSRDISICIRFHDRTGEFHNYQTVGDALATVSIHHGIIYYDKYISKKPGYETFLKEPFEEAAKIVHQVDTNP